MGLSHIFGEPDYSRFATIVWGLAEREQERVRPLSTHPGELKVTRSNVRFAPN
jgi:hypothetical protein